MHTVLSLYDRRAICLYDLTAVVDGSGDNQLKERDVRPTSDEMRQAFSVRDCVGLHAYGLTDVGGDLWEDAAEPDWSRFFTQEWDTDEEGQLEVVATTLETVNRVVTLGPTYWGMQFLSISSVNTVAPWQALYWKSCRIGYRVRVTYHKLGTGPCELQPSEDERLRRIAKYEEAARLVRWYRGYPTEENQIPAH